MRTSDVTDGMLEVKEITSGYGDLDVVSDFSMTVKDGEMACIVGPNGSGKSTILKTIVGIIKPRQGQILLDGKDVTGLEPYDTVRKGICLLPQGGTAFPMMTVLENLLMGAYIIDDREEIPKRLSQAYDLFPVLSKRRKDLASKLSEGERAMLCIARAMMSNPKTMLLDEPSLGLAPKAVDYLYQKLAEFKDGGASAIIVEQNVRKVLSIADYAYVVTLGRKRFEGKPETLSAGDRLKNLYLGTQK